MSKGHDELRTEASRWTSDSGAGEIIARLLLALERATEPIAITASEDLDALPMHSIVGVDDSPVHDGMTFRSRYVCFEKYTMNAGRDSWLELDPGDRDDGESLHPSGYLVARSTRFGKCEPRIRLFHQGESS